MACTSVLARGLRRRLAATRERLPLWLAKRPHAWWRTLWTTASRRPAAPGLVRPAADLPENTA